MAGTLFDNIKKVYRITAKCRNCGEFSEISIPKGVTIDSYLKGEVSRCPRCGCNTLVKYEFPKSELEAPQPKPKPIENPQPKIVFENRTRPVDPDVFKKKKER